MGDQGAVNVEIYDFHYFEDEILPKWIDRFSVDYAKGQFSFFPNDASALYGSIDVVHVLASTGLLANLTESEKDIRAAHISSFQNKSTGLFVDDPRYLTGTQPFHAAGEASASLALLDRKPLLQVS